MVGAPGGGVVVDGVEEGVFVRAVLVVPPGGGPPSAPS